MFKLKKPKSLSHILAFALCICILIAFPLMIKTRGAQSTTNAKGEMSVLSIWQIDGFEGGRGSRATYLQQIGSEFTSETGCYITVSTLTSDAAIENLKKGVIPDLISYGAGICGIESYIRGKTPYYNWCNGGYCFLSVTEGADFSDITIENTVINGGTENLVDVCALFCGINGADKEKPTGAYVKLIGGEYKYLLGTQRDIFRLKTRGVTFTVKPVTEFNDLYQNISVTAKDAKRQTIAENFINLLLSKKESVTKIGLIANGITLYDDEMHAMENLNYEYKLVAPLSESIKNEIKAAISACDVKKLKNLLI